MKPSFLPGRISPPTPANCSGLANSGVPAKPPDVERYAASWLGQTQVARRQKFLRAASGFFEISDTSAAAILEYLGGRVCDPNLKGRTGNGTTGLAPGVHPPFTGTHWGIFRR